MREPDIVAQRKGHCIEKVGLGPFIYVYAMPRASHIPPCLLSF